jgi:hypothetical protein
MNKNHVLITPGTCDCRTKGDDAPLSCPVCDSGLSVCALCGKAEVELDGPCVDRRLVRLAPEMFAVCEKLDELSGDDNRRVIVEALGMARKVLKKL